MNASETLSAAVGMLGSYARSLANSYHSRARGRWATGGDGQQARELHDDLQRAALRLERLQELLELLDEPAVILRIPRPQRLRVSELLHCDLGERRRFGG